MSGCVFCEIVAGREPASFVHRDDACVAFLDIRPVNRGHLLVVPTTHAVGLADLPSSAGASVFEAGRRLAAAVRAAVGCDGVNLLLADGAAAGQEVFHFHLHVLPRFVEDGFGFRFPKAYGAMPSREELDGTAADVARLLR